METCRSDPAALVDEHELLVRYSEGVLRLLVGGAGIDVLGPELDALGVAAGADEVEHGLDQRFAPRFRRLLEVTRLIVEPDPTGELRATITDELEAFAAEVEGAPRELADSGLEGIAPVLVNEVLALHMLLDGVDDRQAAAQKYKLADYLH